MTAKSCAVSSSLMKASQSVGRQRPLGERQGLPSAGTPRCAHGQLGRRPGRRAQDCARRSGSTGRSMGAVSTRTASTILIDGPEPLVPVHLRNRSACMNDSQPRKPLAGHPSRATRRNASGSASGKKPGSGSAVARAALDAQSATNASIVAGRRRRAPAHASHGSSRGTRRLKCRAVSVSTRVSLHRPPASTLVQLPCRRFRRRDVAEPANCRGLEPRAEARASPGARGPAAGRSIPSPGRMASMHARNQGCGGGPCETGMERMIAFYFPSLGVPTLNEGPRGGDTCPPPPHFLSGTNMDEHATDRAPGTRVGQRHLLEPSIADTAAPTPAAPPEAQGLYDPQHEKAACGVGFVVHLKGTASHSIVAQGLELLRNLEHRGACGCEANTGDGAGILVQIPDRFLRKVTAPLGITLPAEGPLRRRPRLPAARRGAARRPDRALRGARPRRGPDRARLARRPDRRLRRSATRPAGPSRSFEQIFIGRGDRHRGRADATRSPSSASSTSSASASSTRSTRSTSPSRRRSTSSASRRGR